jgi:aminopeptidase YwaD
MPYKMHCWVKFEIVHGTKDDCQMTTSRFHAYAVQALTTTEDLIDRFGSRLAGSESCWNAARALQQDLQVICGRADLEPFATHPAAFMGSLQLSAFVYFASVGLLHLNMPFLAAIGFLFISLIGIFEFACYREFIDRLFPQKSCANLIAKLEPEEEAVQQIILSGHHDSAQESGLLRRWQKLYAFKIVMVDFFNTVGLVFSWLWVFCRVGFEKTPAFARYPTWLLTFGILFVLSRLFVVSKRGTPGAGDNLIVSAMLPELAKMFANLDCPGKNTLRRTRLIFVSFDAEESGLRGSRVFARGHKPELQSLPTTMLNIDCVYNVKEVQFLISDVNNTMHLSRDWAERCARLAGKAGYPEKLNRMPFGGGGTDAAELVRVGVEATTLVAMPVGLIRDGLVYHTLGDTVDAIEIEAVEACLHIAHDVVLDIDQHGDGL